MSLTVSELVAAEDEGVSRAPAEGNPLLEQVLRSLESGAAGDCRYAWRDAIARAITVLADALRHDSGSAAGAPSAAGR